MKLLVTCIILYFATVAVQRVFALEKYETETYIISNSSGITPGIHLILDDNGRSRVVRFVLENNDNLDNGNASESYYSTSSISLQPCGQYDTCRDRCFEHSPREDTVGETEHFNCYCDDNCVIFRDCCWDYYEECANIHEPGDSATETNSDTIYADSTFKRNPPNPQFDAFECTVIESFSSEHFWVITRCSSSWPDDHIKEMCLSETPDFLTILPVQGNNGWTYRNAFCAQCNYVTQFQYWSLSSQCFQSAQQEILDGDKEMLSYYLFNFCNNELKRQVAFPGRESSNTSDIQDGIEPRLSRYFDLMYNMPMRRCHNGLVRECPADYEDEFVMKLCEEYQSLVVHRGYVNNKLTRVIFKNPACAYCHGIETGFKEMDGFPNHQIEYPTPLTDKSLHFQNMFERLSWIKNWVNATNHFPVLECPVWLLKSQYDLPYWALSVSSNARAMLPSFQSNSLSRSYWTPPSYSMLLDFRSDGSCGVEYTDDSSSTAYAYTDDSCATGELYDPFYARCRSIVCPPEEVHTDKGCQPRANAANNSNEQSDENTDFLQDGLPSAVTVTVTIQLQAVDMHTNESDKPSKVTPLNQVLSMYMDITNHSITNVTVLGITTIDMSEYSNETNWNRPDGSEFVNIVFSFVLVEPTDVTDDDIVKIMEYISSILPFQMLKVEAELLVIVGLSVPGLGQVPLTCPEGTKKKQYAPDEFVIIYWEGRSILYVNQSDDYYLESEYQFLDWSVTITENGTERSSVDQSRVIACVEVAEMPVYSCDLYVKLNASEYYICNDTLYMVDQNISFSSEEYITHEDTVAVCVDDFINAGNSSQDDHVIQESTPCIFCWISFGFSLLSLMALFTTFVTYLLFRDLRTVAGHCIIHLSAAQFASLTVFIFGTSLTSNQMVCTAITMLLHYLFLSIFFWSNVMAYDVWHTFGKGLQKALRRSVLNRQSVSGASATGMRRTILKYAIYAWGVPAIIVAISASVEFTCDVDVGYIYNEEYGYCWISNPTANFIIFGLPIFLIIVANSVLFALTIIAIRKSATPMGVPKVEKRKFRKKFGSNIHSIPGGESERNMSGFYQKRSLSTSEYTDGSASNTSEAAKEAEQEIRRASDSYLQRKRYKIKRESPDDDINVQEGGQKREFNDNRRQSTGFTASTKHKNRSRARSNVCVYIKMSTVMGFTWIFGFAAAISKSLALWILFELSVPLQGIFILIAFVCKKRVFLLYKNLFCGNQAKDKSLRIRTLSETKVQHVNAEHGRSNVSGRERSETVSSLDDVFEEEQNYHGSSPGDLSQGKGASAQASVSSAKGLEYAAHTNEAFVTDQ